MEYQNFPASSDAIYKPDANNVTKISSRQLSRVLIECQQPAKKTDTWRSELSTFGEKWVKGGSEGFKLPRGSAVSCQAAYIP